MIYDTDLNITWLANANLAAGTMRWDDAQNWIAGMNTANYMGYNHWRLPTVTDTGSPGCGSGTDCGYNVDTATGEMAHLFFDELGNKAYFYDAGGVRQPGWGLTNTGPFSNLQAFGYWTGTGYSPNIDIAWYFDFFYGFQGYSNKGSSMYVLVVHPGDIAAVPVPATAWLFGSGLLGLIGMARRKAA